MTRLPEEECAFFFCAMATLEPELRPTFVERVGNILGAFSPFCDPGPGDVDRAIRQALDGLWVPPFDDTTGPPSRWDRAAPSLRASKRAG
jgi:hypothetical protein